MQWHLAIGRIGMSHSCYLVAFMWIGCRQPDLEAPSQRPPIFSLVLLCYTALPLLARKLCTFQVRFLLVPQAALEHYSVNAVTTGPEALATTRVTLKPRGRIADQGYITSAQVPASDPHQQMLRSAASPPDPEPAR